MILSPRANLLLGYLSSQAFPVQEIESIETTDFPPIKRYENLLSPEECKQIMD